MSASHVIIVSARKEPPPFALVFYCQNKDKGVVETKSLASKARIVGAKCKAPCPIDYEDPTDKKVYDATVIAFGRK